MNGRAGFRTYGMNCKLHPKESMQFTKTACDRGRIPSTGHTAVHGVYVAKFCCISKLRNPDFRKP
jgi:hypothetical protein